MKYYYEEYHDLRLLAIKPLLEEGHITMLGQMFPFLNMKALAFKANIKYQRLRNLMNHHPEKFTVAEIERLAWVLGIESETVMQLIEFQIKENVKVK